MKSIHHLQFFLALLMTILFLAMPQSSFAQSGKVTIKRNNATIKQVLNDIEAQTNYLFIYGQDVNVGQKVNINVKKQAVSKVLNTVFKGKGIGYALQGNHIVLSHSNSANSGKRASGSSAGQNKQPALKKRVQGRVVDEKGEPMIGVTVAANGNAVAVTDVDGNFTVAAVDPSDELSFSYVGYLDKQVHVGSGSQFNVTMSEDRAQLDEVVVVGYGTMKKRDLTGAVGSVRAEDIADVAAANAMQAMQAKIPGVDLMQSDGQAGGDISIKLRGNRSILGSNDPLVIVDGVEYGSTIDINPSDIENIDVLKDAASTAIYGTRGANGVIIITTKRGKAGKTRVSLSFYNRWNSPTNAATSMYGDREVQRLMDKTAYKNNFATYQKTGTWGTETASPEDVLTETLADGTSVLDIYKDKSYTDWGDLLLRNSTTQDYEIGVSGGNEKTNFNISLGMMNDRGLMKNDKFNRYSGLANVDHRINNIFKVGTSLQFFYKSNDKRNDGVYGGALRMTSITHPYLTDGTINQTPNPWYPAHCSPLLDDVPGAYQRNIETTRFFGNVYAEAEPIKGLLYRTQFGLNRTNSRDGLYQDYESQGRFQTPSTNYISSTTQTVTRYTWDNTLNYSTNFGHEEHSFTALLGHEMWQDVAEQTHVYGDAGTTHYYKSAFYDLSKIGSPTVENKYVKQSMVSFFGRVNYSYLGKYLFQASVRTDGSSTLADGHKWGWFPSASVGWRMSEEKFMDGSRKWLSNLKLRASWGLSGNAAVAPYSTLGALSNYNLYYYLGGSDIVSRIPSSMANKNLTWEKTSSFDVGLDYGFLDGRINGTLDLYWNHTYDLLFYKTAPASSVFPSVIDNIGKTKGFGVEVGLNADIIRTNDFKWNAALSYSHITDEITELTEGIDMYLTGTTARAIGQRVNTFYDYKAVGTWGIGEFQEELKRYEAEGITPSFAAHYGDPGTIKIADLNNDGRIDANNDKKFYNQDPDHIFGFNNTFTYKNLSLSVQMMARLGGYISYDMNKYLSYDSANWGSIDYWTPDNQNAKFPTPGLGSDQQWTYNVYSSALLYEKADFFKIKDITLAYSLPQEWIRHAGLVSARVYLSMKNYFTFSHIDDYDPERGGSISFPLQKQVILGVNVDF